MEQWRLADNHLQSWSWAGPRPKQEQSSDGHAEGSKRWRSAGAFHGISAISIHLFEVDIVLWLCKRVFYFFKNIHSGVLESKVI